MSTPEDREWDAERDARTACPECAAEGFGTSLADCPGHDEPEPMPDPDTLTHDAAACWAATCRAVARAIRHELPYATAGRIAEDLDQRAGSYRDRADDTAGGAAS